MVLPALPIIFHDYILPAGWVHQAVSLAKEQVDPFLPGVLPLSPAESMVSVMVMAYAVFGLKLMLLILDGTIFKVDSAVPRGPDNMKLHSPLATRLHGAHANLIEGFGYFAAATLLCLHFGVDAGVLADYCTFYVLSRAVYALFYAAPAIFNPLRTATFFFNLAIVGKMFFLVIDSQKSA